MEATADLPSGWSMFIDEGSGYPCYVNDITGQTQWEKPKGAGAFGKDGGIEMQMSNPMGAINKRQSMGGHHARNSTQLPDGWDKHTDEEGNRYYAEAASGLTAWDAPPGSVGGSAGGGELLTGSHGRSDTNLPDGWSKDTTGPDKYYYNEQGETSWDAPPGSTGGSSGN